MKHEAKRHHYIPQFILRNFCLDNGESLYYFDKHNKTLTIQKTRDVFMTENLYRDEINNPNVPTKIESDFAKFENEVSHIIKSKFLIEKKILITAEEDQKLKLFFALMGFRSKNTSEIFSGKLSDTSKQFYKHFQTNENFEDFWKRNLGYLLNCRSLNDIMQSEFIDEPIKIFMMKDVCGYFGLHFSVAEPKEDGEFIIGDTYPVVITGDIMDMMIYAIHPISPKRTILIVGNGADATPRDVIGFRQCILLPPKKEDDNITIYVKKMYPEEIQHINRLIAKEAKEGFAFFTDKTNSQLLK